jgi:glutamate racemase
MIGIFDSGIGGITVLRELAKNYPHENFIYLGDTARLPYGTKSPQTIRRYGEQNIRFLISKKVKAVVVACNSASSQIPENTFEGVPIFNVIGPGSRKALQVSRSKRIGILGTRATVASQAYQKKIKSLDPEAQVFAEPAPLLVPLAEEGWIDDPITNLIVYRYVQSLLQQNIDTLVLGCTHYPLLKTSITKAVGSGVTLVDSGQALSEELGQSLDVSSKAQRQEILFYTTDASSSHQKMVRQLMPNEEFNFVLADLNPLT